MSAYDPKRTSATRFARLGHQLAVRVTSSSLSSSGTKPPPPHVGHCCSSSVPFRMTPSPLQSGQVLVFTLCLPMDILAMSRCHGAYQSGPYTPIMGPSDRRLLFR